LHSAYRHLLRHRCDVLRPTVSVSETGATAFHYVSASQASVTVDPSGDPDVQDKVTFTSRERGVALNAVSVEYVEAVDTAQLLTIVWTPATSSLTVHLASDGSGDVATTAADLAGAVNAGLFVVSASLPVGSDGSDELTAAGPANLVGGADSTPALHSGLACLVAGGRGRMRQDDQGQVGGNLFSITFGEEAGDLQQNDLAIVTYPVALGTLRLVNVTKTFVYGQSQVQCDAETYMPAGSD
jgi:hypothetical protein